MPFFKESSYKRLLKFFKRHDFTIEQGSRHAKAISKEGQVFVFPRHTKISKGVTRQICNDLVNLGYDKSEIEKEILG